MNEPQSRQGYDNDRTMLLLGRVILGKWSLMVTVTALAFVREAHLLGSICFLILVLERIERVVSKRDLLAQWAWFDARVEARAQSRTSLQAAPDDSAVTVSSKPHPEQAK